MKNSDNIYKIPGSVWRSNHYFVVITDKDGNILAHNDVFKSAAQFNAANIFNNLVESDKVMLGLSLNKLKPHVTRSLTLRSIVNKKIILTSWDFSMDFEQNHFTFLGHDVTKAFNTKIELEKSLSKLSAQKELFRVLLEKNKAGFWYWDLEKDKQKLSPEIKLMLKLENAEGTELTWQSRISNKELKLLKTNLKEHFNSHGTVPFYQEIKNTLPDGSPLWVICFGKVFRWNNGKPQRMVGCFIDITKTKTSEEIILRQNESLRKISFNQSHLMRAKLANIMGLLNILDEKKLNQDNKAFYKLLKKETDKLDKIIRENVSDTQLNNPAVLASLFGQN
ncbi:MAG TPA: PAS domain-containing protein [Anditalea sp.]|nr:PAS domain-containing protein [Anditalea sp.]